MTRSREPIPSDAELIKAAAEDPDAFRLLYDRYAERLHSFFTRRTRRADIALELTAETFSQAWMSRGRFRDLASGSAGPWLFTIARRVLLSSVSHGRLEREALRRLQVDAPCLNAQDFVPEARWLDGLNEDLEAALTALPDSQRQAIELRVLADLPYSQIANEVGSTAAAIRIRVSRGLATLRTRLEASQ